MAMIVQWTSASGAKGNVLTGPFAAGDSWFLVPPALSGVQKPVRGETTINIDTNGDGFADTVFNLPSEVQPDDADPLTQRFDFEHHLSPTQDMLYVKKLGDNGFNICGGPNFVEIYLYQTTSPPTLIPFTGDQGACVHTPLSIQPRFFDHDGDVIRTMYLVGAPFPAGTPTHHAILWADLVNGVSNLDSNTYGHGVLNFPEFAPSGNAVFVIHSNNTSFPKYTFVDLCKSRVGGISGLSGARDLGAPFVSAHVIEPSTGQFDAIIQRNGNDVPGSNVRLDVSCFKPPTERACCFTSGDCFDLFPDSCIGPDRTPDPEGRLCIEVTCEDTTTQACCFPDGDCDVLLEALCTDRGGVPQPGFPTCEFAFCPLPQEACCLLQGICQDTDVQTCADNRGTSQGPGTVCNGTIFCPELALEVSAFGPATAELGEVFDYTLSYANTGDLDGAGVILTAFLPPFIEFVSASDNGMQPSGFGEVTWDLGNLAVGASGQATLTVRADCLGFLGDVTFSFYYLSDSRGPSFDGIVPVITTVSKPTTGGIDVQVTSTPAAPLPLKPADIVTHAVTLTNLVNRRQPGLTFEFRAGPDATLNSLIDPGSGFVDRSSANRWTWEGVLEPLATTAVSFTTRMHDCLTGTQTALNDGEIVVTHACGDILVRTATPTLPVRPVLHLALGTTNFPPPSRLVSFTSDRLVQLVRLNQPIDFRLTFGNNTPNALSSVTASVPIPFFNLSPGGIPPFIPPTDPGATYNAISHTINWSGPLAPGQTVVISYRATLHNSGGCMVPQSADANDGTCNYSFPFWLEGVPEPPTEPHLVLISGIGNVATFRPGVDSTLQPMFCSAATYLTDLAVADNGDIWLSGSPTLRFNPATLAIEGFPLSFFGDLGLPLPSGVAFDSTDGTVVFTGTRYDDNGLHAVARRYDPDTRTITSIFEDPNSELDGILNPLIDREGHLVGIPTTPPFLSIVRINPADPANYQSYGNSSYGSPTTLALDTDGDYVSPFVLPAPSSTPLAKIERNTGDFNAIVDNLQTVTGFFGAFNACAVGDNGDVYLATPGSALFVVHRTGSGGTEPLTPPSHDFGQDMEWVVPSTVPGDANGDGLINLRDFSDFARCFSLATSSFPECACADFNANGTIDLADLQLLANNLGRTTSAGPPGCP